MPVLAAEKKCTGCSACANSCPKSAITMEESREGFLFPIVDSSKCIGCGLCERTCPIISKDCKTDNLFPLAYALWSVPDREFSSSGGAFSAFARYVVENSGVVFGAVLCEDFHVRHVYVDTLEGLPKLRGSKYIQSEVSASFNEVKRFLSQNRKVLFVGTPCQIAGLKAFLKRDYENLLLLDLVCHGVPSYKVFASYIDKLVVRKQWNRDDVKDFDFRRRDGWDKTAYVFVKNKRKAIYGVDALFTEAFDAASIFRESCYLCNYSTLPRTGDCTIADFWGLGLHGIPFRQDVSKGVSLVLVNTRKGEESLKQLKNVFVEKRPLAEALVENHNLSCRTEPYPRREELIHAFLDQTKTLEAIDRDFSVVDLRIKAKVKTLAKKLGLFALTSRLYRCGRKFFP